MFLSKNQFVAWTLIAITGVGVAHLWAQARAGSAINRTKPEIGKARRYVNPLNIEADSKDGSPTGVSLGDPTVVKDGNKFYMFATGGGPWVSDDLVIWRYAPLSATGARVPVAPHVMKYKGEFYMTGNGAHLFRSANILGPYEDVGAWLDEKGNPIGAQGGASTPSTANPVPRVFDVCVFVDSDDKPYVYMAFGATGGVWAAPLDPKNLNRLTTAPKTLFAFNGDHVFERSGNANERSYYAYIEGPWVFKRNGTYYVEYSASGTEWLTYATGVYTSKSPLGPFTFMRGNPLLRQVNGVVTGPGHGSTIQGPNGDWWQFYLTVLPNPPGGRRIGMDPIGFDAQGNMFVRGGVPSDTPQWAPGVVPDPVHNGDSGSVPLTFSKIRNLVSSSHAPGRDAAYALDNLNGTWWEPADGDAQPSLTVDLLQIAPFDKPYTVDSSRIIFTMRAPVGFGGGGRGGGGANPGNAAPGAGRGAVNNQQGATAASGNGRGRGNVPPPAPFSGSPAFRYRLECSLDGTDFSTLVDKTSNSVIRYVEFDETPPTPCRFVRLTMSDWPRSAQQPLAISEFTVFGKYIEPAVKTGAAK